VLTKCQPSVPEAVNAFFQSRSDVRRLRARQQQRHEVQRQEKDGPQRAKPKTNQQT
jgi:hypothetical protein